MAEYLARIQKTIALVERQIPEECHDLILPHLVLQADTFAKDHAIRFAQVGRKFVVDNTEFRNVLGFGYLQAILSRPGRFVNCGELSPIPTNAEFSPVAEYSVIRKYTNRKASIMKELKWLHSSHHDSDDYDDHHHEKLDLAEELLRIQQLEAEQKTAQKFLNKATYNGRRKYLPNAYSRNRQSVCKCIRLAIDYLMNHPDTKAIGYHLRNDVQTGTECRYNGKWRFISS